MTGRRPMMRVLALMWATLQLVSPALSAVADGHLASRAAGAQVAHVESTSAAGCPIVHAPDCAVCRYLSGAGTPVMPLSLAPGYRSITTALESQCPGTGRGAARLPHGRAPPLV